MLLKYVLAAAFIAVSAAPALAETCVEPIAPSAVDGTTASKDKINQARDDTVRYIKQSDEYQTCLFADLKAQKMEAVKNKKTFPASIEDGVNERVKANQDRKEKVGAEYNAAAVAFKKLHPEG
ncbi:MAG TPA: hypothetical protein VL026_13640 [Rhizomicrobium sp.]|nr:hypothetical protein [Rhizomicrobium sp.]